MGRSKVMRLHQADHPSRALNRLHPRSTMNVGPSRNTYGGPTPLGGVSPQECYGGSTLMLASPLKNIIADPPLLAASPTRNIMVNPLRSTGFGLQ